MAYRHKIKKVYATPFEHGLELIGGKWNGRVLGILHYKEPLRFGEIKNLLPGITAPVLSTSLKKLTQEKIVVRKQYDEIPMRVEYSLTERGEELVKLCQDICSFSCKYYPRDPDNEYIYCRNCTVNPLKMGFKETDDQSEKK